VKNTIKYILQTLLGFKTYLYVFALFKIKTLASDKKERDFFHFLKLMKDGKGDVLDIGANLGIMTVHLAQHLPNTQIHAFEPIPTNVSVLRKIIRKFQLKKTTVHEIALGDSPGIVKMVIPELGKAKQQGLSHVKHESIPDLNEGEEFEVKMDRLDNIINGQAIQGIKIDVENFEYFALKGGKRILEQNHPIIYAELWENENRTNCFSLLSEMGYTTHVIENETLVKYDSSKHCKQNFIFIPNA
jgi:FkbM family methyltransferase